jgi:hypothetical protein
MREIEAPVDDKVQRAAALAHDDRLAVVLARVRGWMRDHERGEERESDPASRKHAARKHGSAAMQVLCVACSGGSCLALRARVRALCFGYATERNPRPQAKTTVGAHQRIGEEPRPLHPRRQADRRSHREQAKEQDAAQQKEEVAVAAGDASWLADQPPLHAEAVVFPASDAGALLASADWR